MIRQAHRIPTRTFEQYLDRVLIAFAIIGVVYFMVRLF